MPYIGDDAALELLSELAEEEEAENRRECPECGSDDVEHVQAATMGRVFECCTCGHDFDEDGAPVEPVNRF